MFVVIGYESDLYFRNQKSKGTAEDYHKMWENFASIFEEEGAKNAIFAMEFSTNISDNFDFADLLWPRNVNIEWLFWNNF